MNGILENRGLWGAHLHEFETLASTNQWALDNIRQLGHGDVVRAIRQTSGRGRFDRKWFSPADRCLTISVVIKPKADNDTFISTLGFSAALAVRSALERHSIDAMVKWPNDVVVNGRKIAGILIERESNTGALVLGIGLNVNLAGQDIKKMELSYPATSMAIETGMAYNIGQVYSAVTGELQRFLEASDVEGIAAILREWRKHDFLTGKAVEVQTTECRITGKYAGIDPSGRLMIVDEAGKESLFWTGDVTLRVATHPNTSD